MSESRLRAPGMSCPQCGQPILVDPQQLLSGAPIGCTACGLELRVNREQSAETLAALEAYLEQLQQAESEYREQVGGMLGKRPASRRSRARRTRETGASPRRRSKR